ncbi:PhoX family protein [Rhizobium wuzhouense]|uniref:dTDP-glucose 4,6-dehydratase n=1 Tax=Rhizobium wuzhouense TaxID=1986026 RepID=A0ABX5NR74_9HYPH|nr:PhoX family phosphatase [Rhizobium wuzhouense]PYB73295.1 dTDP-glucose 4,6-dehydratase [Rhizobium wuzhouense]
MADCPSNSSPIIRDVIAARASRRAFLSGAASLGALAAGSGFVGSFFAEESFAASATSSLGFSELKRVYDKDMAVAPGYTAEVVARWGDPIAADVADFSGEVPSAAEQLVRFGYNCDYIAFMPLPKGSATADHGLLCVNNEYISPNVIFDGMTEDDAGKMMTQEQVDFGMAAMGHSIVEVKIENGRWAMVKDSPFNRRLTVETKMQLSGPVAGHDLVKTKEDPQGLTVKGTNYNCGGGVTPWGTVLTCEEGASDTFGGSTAGSPIAAVLDRYGFDGSDLYGRARFHDRFDMDKEPNEPNRFDWVVEIDPYDPQSTPIKRTALGRMSHEASTVVHNKDGRIVVYMGDDDYFEYTYRFVTEAAFDPAQPETAKDILDKGVLSVARFDTDGTLHWLPLVHGQGPLTAENGFASQADVLLKTRLAADAVGATPMDRPEDFETNPVTGRVYAVMTKNKKREQDKLNPANTRPENLWGHIVELIPPGGRGKDADHTAEVYQWDLFVLAGNPKDEATKASFHPETSENGWFVCPDNISFDPQGRLWVATDGANDFGLPDGIYGIDTEGPARGLPKLLFTCPAGAEATGPCFTPDGKTLFVSVQHPAEDAETLDKATTLWPDFNGKLPRPSVVAIRRQDGAAVGV